MTAPLARLAIVRDEARYDWVDAHLYDQVENFDADVDALRSRLPAGFAGHIVVTEFGGPLAGCVARPERAPATRALRPGPPARLRRAPTAQPAGRRARFGVRRRRVPALPQVDRATVRRCASPVVVGGGCADHAPSRR